MPYGVHERLRSHRGVDLTGKPRDLALAYYQYKVSDGDCQEKLAKLNNGETIKRK